MPVWLTGKLIGYAAGGLLTLALVGGAYIKVKNYFIGVDNLHMELSNQRDRANRAEVSLSAELLANQLRENHAAEITQIRAEAQERINDIREEAQIRMDVLSDRERLERVTLAKPKLVEKSANKATERVFNDLETIYNSN